LRQNVVVFYPWLLSQHQPDRPHKDEGYHDKKNTCENPLAFHLPAPF
jgi:hypothetical protein